MHLYGSDHFSIPIDVYDAAVPYVYLTRCMRCVYVYTHVRAHTPTPTHADTHKCAYIIMSMYAYIHVNI